MKKATCVVNSITCGCSFNWSNNIEIIVPKNCSPFFAWLIENYKANHHCVKYRWQTINQLPMLMSLKPLWARHHCDGGGLKLHERIKKLSDIWLPWAIPAIPRGPLDRKWEPFVTPLALNYVPVLSCPGPQPSPWSSLCGRTKPHCVGHRWLTIVDE